MVDLAVVKILGDSSTNKFVIPLRLPNTNITFDALVNTGSQGCFIDSKFVGARLLPLLTKSTLICCVAFDGTPGVGGLVDQEWIGAALFGDTELPLTLGATNLGKHQAILGLPWLDSVHARITCGPNGRLLEFEGLSVAAVDVDVTSNVDFCKSHSSFSPNSLSLVPDSIEPLSHQNSQITDPTSKYLSSFSLPDEFKVYTSVFVPQNIVLPPIALLIVQ